MEFLESLQTEALQRPLSFEDLLSCQKAVESLQKFWPMWSPFQQTDAPHRHLLQQQSEEWKQFATNVHELRDASDDVVPWSRIHFARTGEISDEDISAHLDLQRNSGTKFTIASVTPYERFESLIGDLDPKKTWVIPVKCASSWCFAVAYPDCTHWYDSSGVLQKPSLLDWPRHNQSRKSDTGVVMLLGIRLVANGLPHASNQHIEKGLESFRVRLLVELCCQKIDPDQQAFEAVDMRVTSLLDRQRDVEPSSFFLDAWVPVTDQIEQPLASGVGNEETIVTSTTDALDALSAANPLPRTDVLRLSPDATTSEVADNNSENYNDGFESRGIDLRVSQEARSTPYGLDNTVRNRRSPSSYHEPHEWSSPVDYDAAEMKSILLVLKNAVIMARSTPISPHMSIPALCNAVGVGIMTNDFHYRYYQTRLYEMIAWRSNGGEYEINPRQFKKLEGYFNPISRKHLREKGIRKEAKLWLELCDICALERINVYSLLCAIPKRRRFSETRLDNLVERLKDPGDQLQTLMREISGLCEAILTCKLPSNFLAIETFSVKQFETFTFQDFTTFTSHRSNHRVPISYAHPPARNR